MLDVSLLGTGGMMPMPERFLSSMILRLNGRLYITDCGEGTQVSLKKLGWGFKAIDAIFFTHYHADHISGLPGMFHAMANAGRTEPLKLIGPKGLVFVVEGLRRIAAELPYEIEYTELDGNNADGFMTGDLYVNAISAVHSVKCVSYSFQVHRKGRFDLQKALSLNVPKKMWSLLQNGESVKVDEKIILPESVMGESRKGIKLVYATDTRPFDELADFARGADLFICEGMYGENEKKDKAVENKHMLFSEAAEIAKKAQVKELWLTHFSPALSNPEEYIENAASIFENTKLGFDGMVANLMFEN